MRSQMGLTVVLALLMAIVAVLNPDLLAREIDVNLFGTPTQWPLVTLLLAFGPGSWLLYLAAGSLDEWNARRRVQLKNQEILGLKAAAYDRPRQAPVLANGAVDDGTLVDASIGR